MTGCDGLALHDARPWVVAGQHVGRYEPASILAALPGFGGLDPALLTGKTIRQIDAQTIASGVSVGGFFVVSDAAAALLFDKKDDAARWANNHKHVNIDIAESLTYVANGHSNGGQLAVVDSTDLIKLLMGHPKMKHLRDEAGTAFVERETGAVGGIVRSVQAATAPTEGQRMLQAGYNGVIANGESREQTTSTIDPNGQLTHEHLAQRSTVFPDGQGVHVQQAVVQARADWGDALAIVIHGLGGAMTSAVDSLNKKIYDTSARQDDLRELAIANEVKSREEAIANEVKSHEEAIANEVKSREDAIANEVKSREDAIAHEVKSREEAIARVERRLDLQEPSDKQQSTTDAGITHPKTLPHTSYKVVPGVRYVYERLKARSPKAYAVRIKTKLIDVPFKVKHSYSTVAMAIAARDEALAAANCKMRE